MSWQMLVLLSVITISIGNLLQRVVIKEEGSDPWAYSIFFQLLVGIFIAVYGFLVGEMNFPANIKPLLGNLIALILLWSASNIFLFSSLKRIEASVFTVIFSTRGLFTALASSILLREFLTTEQLIGALFIVCGAALVSLKHGHLRIGKGELFALLAACTFGFANTNDRILLQSIELYPYITISFILPAIFMILIRPSSLIKMKIFTHMKILKKMIILCAIFSFSSITFFAALQKAPNSSQVATLSISSVILTVILAVIFLKERDRILRKTIGTVTSFLGLLLLG